MRKLFSILSFVLLYITFAHGQAAVNIQLSGSDGTATIPMAVGLDLTATDCIDPALGESELPPLPPAGVFDIRFMLPSSCGPLNGLLLDYRNAPAFPFTGTIQHTLHIQRAVTGTAVDITYDLPTGATMTVQDQFGGILYTSGPKTGTGILTITGNGATISDFYVIMAYINVGPSGPAPQFAINPASLSFGNVTIGNSATLPATISNPGTAELDISNIVSSDPQFTFSPNTFPITVPIGGNQVLNVTFTPTVGGLTNAHLTFTHNAAGGSTSYAVGGTGVELIQPLFPPEFNLLNFPTNGSMDTTFNVTNNGSVPLDVTASITQPPLLPPALWSIDPTTPVTIPAGESRPWTLSFVAPPSPGTYTGTLTFTAPGAPPVTIHLSASVVSVAGLIFEKDTPSR